MYVGHGVIVGFCFIFSVALCKDIFPKRPDYSEYPVPNVTLLKPRGIQIDFEGQHWIKDYTVVMNINEPFKYDPFNYFQIGQITQKLRNKRTVYRRHSTTAYWIYHNLNLQLKHGDEIHYYLKVNLLDDKSFTKLYHYVRVENDTDINKLVIAEDEVYLLNIKEFLLINNFTFQALKNYKMRRARSNELAQEPNFPGVGRVIALFDKHKVLRGMHPQPKTFKEYIE